MKSEFLSVALLASTVTIAQANPAVVQRGGGGHHGGAVAHAAPVGRMPMRAGGVGGLSSFHPMPARTYAPVYSGQRYSSFGMRSSPSVGFNRSYAYSRGATITRSGPYTTATIRQPNQAYRFSRFANYRNPAATGVWNQPITGNGFRNGSNIRNANNIRNPNNIRNGNTLRNASNHLRGDWQRHVYAQRSGDWHRDWDTHGDHWWNGHRCCFINGSWVIFNVGFDPWWWSSWGYPDYYFYDNGFPYDGYGSSTYGYNYPYSSDPGHYDSGEYQMEYDQNSYPNDQSQDYYYDANAYQSDTYYTPNDYNDQSYSNYSIVVAAQERLAREGYYQGESDGAVGPQMRQALTGYQRSHGLRVTGYLDGDTVALMGLR